MAVKHASLLAEGDSGRHIAVRRRLVTHSAVDLAGFGMGPKG